jgi:hypothetical protein
VLEELEFANIALLLLNALIVRRKHSENSFLLDAWRTRNREPIETGPIDEPGVRARGARTPGYYPGRPRRRESLIHSLSARL